MVWTMMGNPFAGLPQGGAPVPQGGAPLPPGLRGGTLPLNLIPSPVTPRPGGGTPTGGGGVPSGGGSGGGTPGGSGGGMGGGSPGGSIPTLPPGAGTPGGGAGSGITAPSMLTFGSAAGMQLPELPQPPVDPRFIAMSNLYQSLLQQSGAPSGGQYQTVAPVWNPFMFLFPSAATVDPGGSSGTSSVGSASTGGIGQGGTGGDAGAWG